MIVIEEKAEKSLSKPPAKKKRAWHGTNPVRVHLFSHARFAKRPFCSNSAEQDSLKKTTQNEAFRFSNIQANSESLIYRIVFKISKVDAATAATRDGLPAFNWISMNTADDFADVCYELASPICVSANARNAPIRYLAFVESHFRRKIGGDKSYRGLMCKNPNHSDSQTSVPREKAYTLAELAEYIDATEARSKEDLCDSPLGRNVTLFDRLRSWAYGHRKHCESDAALSDACKQHVRVLNTFDYPLATSECEQVARSVSGWVWKSFDVEKSNKKFSAKQKRRGARTTRKAGKASGVVRAARSDLRAEKALELQEKGMSKTAIALAIGISRSRVSELLKSKQGGVDERQYHAMSPALPPPSPSPFFPPVLVSMLSRGLPPPFASRLLLRLTLPAASPVVVPRVNNQRLVSSLTHLTLQKDVEKIDVLKIDAVSDLTLNDTPLCQRALQGLLGRLRDVRMTHPREAEVVYQSVCQFFFSSMKTGKIPQIYSESASGRLYANGLNLQNAKSEIKRAALSGLYEYDFSNCHFAILRQMSAKIGFTCSAIEHYLENKISSREAIAADAGITIKHAKFALLAIMYGAKASMREENAIPAEIGVAAAERLYKNAQFKAIAEEVETARSLILAAWPVGEDCTLKNACGKTISKSATKSQKLAHLLQGAEAAALRATIDLYRADLVLLQHDGFVSKRKLDTSKIKAAVFAATGYTLELEESRVREPELA